MIQEHQNGNFILKHRKSTRTQSGVKDRRLRGILGAIIIADPSVRHLTGIRREGRRNFGDQRTGVHNELCTLSVD